MAQLLPAVIHQQILTCFKSSWTGSLTDYHSYDPLTHILFLSGMLFDAFYSSPTGDLLDRSFILSPQSVLSYLKAEHPQCASQLLSIFASEQLVNFMTLFLVRLPFRYFSEVLITAKSNKCLSLYHNYLAYIPCICRWSVRDSLNQIHSLSRVRKSFYLLGCHLPYET